MKTAIRYGVAGFLILAAVGLVFADNFKSLTVTATSSPQTIRVHGDQLMFIRNFTQDGGTTTRGTVSVEKPPGADAINVLTAAMVDDTNPPEVINTIVIAGPADVLINCPDPAAICFISYRKGSN